MKYDEIIKYINHLDGIFKDYGKLAKSALDMTNFPNSIKELLLLEQDHYFFKTVIDLYYNEKKIQNNTDKINITDHPKYIKYNDIIYEWIISDESEFFNDINDQSNISNQDIVNYRNEHKNMDLKFVPRENQIEAFEKLEKNGLETGIHCQATGCGKTYIILYYIDYVRRQCTNHMNIILFTERVNILADLFQLNKNVLVKDTENIARWKNMGLCDLTNFNIINRVTIKKNDWPKLLNESKEPTLLIINRAFLTGQSKYKSIRNLALVLHDECHNTSSEQCHNFLKYCKGLNVPIVGFSATPLRTGKNDKPKLMEIYCNRPIAIGDRPKGDIGMNNLNLLTNYNMVYAISKNLIVPPKFSWNVNEKVEPTNFMYQINKLCDQLIYKKIIVWCKKIDNARNWYNIFGENHKKIEYTNLNNFTYGLDTSERKNNADYNNFKESKGCAILFCACKHREGSDIKYLDACVFNEDNKTRSSIPFIQSVGRVLRIDGQKDYGTILDFVKVDDKTYDKNIVDKIIGYYMALHNIADINSENNKILEYYELLHSIKFKPDQNKIRLRIGQHNIDIDCYNINWSNIINEFNGFIERTLNVSEKEKLELEYKILKEKIRKKQFNHKLKYKKYARKKNLEMNPEEKYINYGFINYYDFLDIPIDCKFNEEIFQKICVSNKLKNITKYVEYAKYNNYPIMPEELIKGNIEQYFYKKSKRKSIKL